MLFEPVKITKYFSATGEFIDFRQPAEFSAFLFVALIFFVEDPDPFGILFVSRQKVNKESER